MKRFLALFLAVTIFIFIPFSIVEAGTSSKSKSTKPSAKSTNKVITNSSSSKKQIPKKTTKKASTKKSNSNSKTKNVKKAPVKMTKVVSKKPSIPKVSTSKKSAPVPVYSLYSSLQYVKLYSSKHQEFAAIPVTYTASKGSPNASQGIKLVYSINKKEHSTEIIVANTKASMNYSKKFESLKKELTIQNIDANRVKITTSVADNSALDIYTVNKKTLISVDKIVYTTYLVLRYYETSSLDQEVLLKGPTNLLESSTGITSDDKSDTDVAAEKQIDEKILSRKNTLITIDPGHGGKDPGAVANGMLEKDINLDISTMVKSMLEEQGYDVYMTRNTDVFVELSERANSANIIKSSLFVSIHNNANVSNVPNGTTVLYNSKAVKPAQKLAENMRNEIAKNIGTSLQRLEDRPNLAVLNTTQVPAVLAEIGFMTNAQDAAKLKSPEYREKAAQAIVDSINMYFEK